MKILIAEDDAVSRLMLGRTLQQWGHEVIAAANEQGMTMIFTGRRHFKH